MKQSIYCRFTLLIFATLILIAFGSCESEESSIITTQEKISPFGLDVFLYCYAPFTMEEAQAIADFDVAANVKWTREEFECAVVEPVKGEPNTELLDA